jgi:VWFA-related protein
MTGNRNANYQTRISFYLMTCLIISLAAFSSPVQQKEQPSQTIVQRKTPTFSVEAAMVVVDVSVRDRKGNLLPGLKRGDFKIYEDNVPQDIVTFAAENIAIGGQPVEAAPAAPAAPAKAPAAPEPAPAKPAEPVAESKPAPAPEPTINLGLEPDKPIKKEDIAGKRLVILFFDLSSLGTEDLIRSVESATEFISKQTGPQDLMSIASYDSELSLVQDFTNDRDLLLKTLETFSAPDNGESAESLSDADTSGDVYVPDTVQFDVFNTDRRLAAIENLAKMYREFPERKSLLYFSGGGRTTGNENDAQIRSTIDNANRSNLSIYAVDTRGLQALPPGGSASQASAGRGMFGGGAMSRQRSNQSGSQETMATLSHDTGGKLFTDSNDLSLAMKQVQLDSHIYYVIGYFSSNPKEDGKYRKIRVEVTQPGLKVEHRPGYFAAKHFAQLNQQEKDLQLQQALNVDRPFVEVPLILQADYFRKDNSTAYVPISLLLDGDGLEFEDKGDNREGKFEFVAQAIDAKGKVTGVARDAVQVRLPKDKADKIRDGGIFYTTGFQLKPGDYKLKFLVRDNKTGKMGSFEQPLEIPSVLDLKKLTTSSIVLGNQLTGTRDSSGSGVSHQGATGRFQAGGFTGYDPLVVGNRKLIPSIGNVFVAKQTVYVYFQVYGAQEDKESKKPCIETDLVLIRDNTKILETQPKYVQEWSTTRSGFLFGGFGGRRGGENRGGDNRGGGMPGGMPGGGEMRGRGMPEGGFPGGGRGGEMGRGGPPGMEEDERKGESTVAISLPLKSFKKGTYTLQIHVRDEIAGVNHFQRVPLVIE